MAHPQHLRVFVASPGDVASERALALEVVERLNYDPAFRGKLWLEVVAWDKPGGGTPMLATMTPQAAIAAGLPKPSECDMVVVVIWSRMGTPLPLDEYRKPDGTAYVSGTEWEYLDALQAAKSTGRPEVLVYRRTEKVVLDQDDPDYDEKRRQYLNVKDFFAGFRNADGTIRSGCNDYPQPDDFREQLDLHLRSLIQRRLAAPGAAAIPAAATAVPTPPLWEGSPFPGLRAFTPEDAPIFFGRGRESDELLQRLRNPACRFLAVVGASGSGKSSLIGAGLIPRLRDNGVEGSKDWLLPQASTSIAGQRKHWSGLRFTPGELGSDPFLSLAAKLQALLPDDSLKTPQLAEALRQRPATFPEFLGLALEPCPPWSEVLVFIDQFEELFTVVEESHRGPFIALLIEAARAPRVRLVLSLRADFYHRCVAWPDLAELLRQGSFPLAAPRVGTLHQMIVGPAARAGLVFEDGLPERILDDTGDDPGALALLAFALHAVYEEGTGDGTLSHDAFKTVGGVQRAIAQRAEAVHAKLPEDVQRRLTDVFRDLVEVDDRGTASRRRALCSSFASDAAAQSLVDAFIEGRLLLGDYDESGQSVVEVAHEALFRVWPRLAEWIDKTADDHRLRRQIGQLATYWNNHERRDEHRWPDERVREAADMLQHLGLCMEQFSPVEQAFLGPLDTPSMLREIEDSATEHERRAMIGVRLALLGDPRPGVGLNAEGLPDIQWIDIPGGEATIEIRTDRNDPNSPVAEILTRRVNPFRIARYPVTVDQFRAFLSDCFVDGHWHLPVGCPVTLHNEDAPPHHRARYGNHPADSVNWWDALAFCHWLSARLRDGGQLPAGAVIRLPTEFEWQWAATGGNPGNVYPWGEARDPHLANTGESDLGRSTAVGLYPAGASVDGVLDLAGTLWEWCGNAFADPDNLALPVDRSDRRVMRGGSWSLNMSYARSAYRFYYNPGNRYLNIGFRLLSVSPIN